MEEINKRLELIDRFSKLIGLPVIRAYSIYPMVSSNPSEQQVIDYLSGLGYEEVGYFSVCDSIFISEYMSTSFLGIISVSSILHHEDYSKLMPAFKDLTVDEISSMSDEELILLTRLN